MTAKFPAEAENWQGWSIRRFHRFGGSFLVCARRCWTILVLMPLWNGWHLIFSAIAVSTPRSRFRIFRSASAAQTQAAFSGSFRRLSPMYPGMRRRTTFLFGVGWKVAHTGWWCTMMARGLNLTANHTRAGLD